MKVTGINITFGNSMTKFKLHEEWERKTNASETNASCGGFQYKVFFVWL